jgi:hypothetical protein
MTILSRAWAIVRREIDVDVILLALAVGLIAIGFWDWWRPGAFVVPGLVVLWIVLPSRRPFVVRDQQPSDPVLHQRKPMAATGVGRTSEPLCHASPSWGRGRSGNGSTARSVQPKNS